MSDEQYLRDDLSAVVKIGNTLWLANDEAISLERLTSQPENGDGVQRYGGSHPIRACGLPSPARAPDYRVIPKIVKADVEGLDYRDGYLWLVGSHSRKREQPKKDKPEKGFKRLAEVTSDGNRFLLARIPLVEDNGTTPCKKSAVHNGKELVAAQLRGTSAGDDLLDALQGDEHLAPFLAIPGKDNGFDIEGLAVQGNRLFIGLRGPVLRGWAVILEVEPEDDPTDRSILKAEGNWTRRSPLPETLSPVGRTGHSRPVCTGYRSADSGRADHGSRWPGDPVPLQSKEVRLGPIAHTDDPWSRSQLFTVRIWHEHLDAQRWEMRAQVKHVLTGETRFFRDWPALAAYLTSKLDAPPAAG